jgi:hypothetical protein
MRQQTMDSIVANSDDFLMLLRVLTKNNEDSNDDCEPSKRKRVRFSTEVTTSAPARELTPSERKDLWYDSEAISNFKIHGRKAILSKKGYRNSNSNSNSNVVEQDDEEVVETTRGFENCTLERQLQRHRTVQSVVSSHRKGMSPGQTATVSKRCSKWNRDIAILQARHDYLDVYQPGAPLPAISNKPPTFPFALRRSSDTDPKAQQRRVRRRTRL